MMLRAPRPDPFVAQRITDLEAERDALQAECRHLRALIESLATRVAAQSEMLGRAAERRAETADRIGALQLALGEAICLLGPSPFDLSRDSAAAGEYPGPPVESLAAARARLRAVLAGRSCATGEP